MHQYQFDQDKNIRHRTFKWICLFFVAISLFALVTEFIFADVNDTNQEFRVLFRSIVCISNIGLAIFTVFFKIKNSFFLKIPILYIFLNFFVAIIITVFGYADIILAQINYLVISIVYALSFSFFVSRGFATPLFGIFLLLIQFLIFKVFSSVFFNITSVQQSMVTPYNFLLAFGIIATTGLFSINNKISHSINLKLEKYSSDLERLAFTDRTTGLANAQQLSKDMEKKQAEKDFTDQTYVMIGFRIEGLEIINETKGIEYANQLLRDLVLLYQTNATKDLSNNKSIFFTKGFSTLYRIESNTFAYMLTNQKGVPYEQQPKFFIKQAIDQILAEYNENFPLSFRGGISIFPVDANNLEQLTRNVLNIVHSKSPEGLGVFTFFEQNRYEFFLRQTQLKSEIKSAIDAKEFRLVFQPKVNIETEEIVGFEALARWNSSKYGNISPNEFIELTEENGAINELTLHLLENAISFVDHLTNEGLWIPVSLNLSPDSIKPYFIEGLFNRLARSGLSHLVEFEITEGTMMKISNEVSQSFQLLKDIGVNFSIDDFGTGYSNLGYLQQFEAQTLKIDKSFIDDIAYNEKKRKLVQTIIKLGKAFGMNIVAEGVEYEDQKKVLFLTGCDIIQGYYYSKPLEFQEAILWAKDSLARRNQEEKKSEDSLIAPKKA